MFYGVEGVGILLEESPEDDTSTGCTFDLNSPIQALY